MTQPVRYGTPLFTDGVFGVARAQDDLGVEEVGAGLLRRLIPGVIQNTPNAGYYSFYPYLLWKWEQLGGAIEESGFIPFYRRQEAALSVACALHHHRGDIDLIGVNGALEARPRAQELSAGQSTLDLARQADRYMVTRLGGYRLFYAAALQDMRLVTAGAEGLVDRVTDRGAAVARAFAEAFEDTEYARTYLTDGDQIPVEVLRELGDKACLCTIPGRSDHRLLLDTFFGEPDRAPAWEERRRLRVQSLVLLLEFHEQRPAQAEAGLAAWRRALIDPRYSDGSAWRPSNRERWESWRAYQLREVAVLALTSIWSLYLAELAARGRATHAELAAEMRGWLTRERIGFPPEIDVHAAIGAAEAALPDAESLARDVEPLPTQWRDEPKGALCRAIRALLVLPREVADEAPGFTELLDEGGSYRWSLRHLTRWLQAHRDSPLTEAAVSLLSALHHQHVRVALTKLRSPNAQNLGASGERFRDPFNFAEDEGELRPLRPDEPSWSGARYSVANHLLWSLGLLDAPAPPIGLTDLGHQVLQRHARDA